jgi:DNA-binding PadR family transcriptional regulator
MALPPVTHLQFLILDLVRQDAHSGRFIRERLAEESAVHSGPAFYQLMARLEEAKLVSGWYESQVISGQTIKERRYEITAAGRRAHSSVHSFYANRLADAQLGLKKRETDSQPHAR